MSQTTGNVTVAPGNLGISFTTGTVNGIPAVVANFISNSGANNANLPVQQGQAYYVGPRTVGKYQHMIVDDDNDPVLIEDIYESDTLTGRAVFYNAIIELNA